MYTDSDCVAAVCKSFQNQYSWPAREYLRWAIIQDYIVALGLLLCLSFITIRLV